MVAPKARCEYRLPPDVYLEVRRRAKACGLTNSAYVEGCLRGSWARWDALDAGDGIVPLPRRLPSPPPPPPAPSTTYPIGNMASADDFRRDIPLPARRRWWQRRQPHTSES